ncbi:Ligand binding domain of hormone receptors protein, partial [Tyrophagus putrescentiae]
MEAAAASAEEILGNQCQVCGDVACAINHRALTCHSCRMFFKRHADKFWRLKCRKAGNCPIDRQTRAACQWCRLQRCLSVGMRLNRLTEARPRKVYRANCRILLDGFISEQLAKFPSSSSSEDDPNSSTFSSSSSSSSSSSPPLHLFCPLLELSPTEASLIAEVDAAIAASFVEENRLPVTGSRTSSIDVLNMLSLYARQIVRFCKSIAAFRLLPKDDQLTILKPFYFEIMVIRISYHYDEQRHAFPLVNSERADSVFYVYMRQERMATVRGGGKGSTYKNKNGSIRGRRHQRRFVRALHEEMEGDLRVRNLLIALALFKSRDHFVGAGSREFVRYQYRLYTRLLRRHLEVRTGSAQLAEERFIALTSLNSDFAVMRDKVLAYVKSVDINQVTDLVAEIFDMNHLSFDTLINFLKRLCNFCSGTRTGDTVNRFDSKNVTIAEFGIVGK